nr:helix-turn-helix domain-containing protein [Caballeronia sp. SEWSISQ10-4 2]
MDETTRRRLRGGRMLLAGRNVVEVALAMGVTRQTVSIWKGRLDKGGINALRTKPRSGRPARLSEAQLGGLRRALLQSSTEHGFGTQLWTIKRVGVLITRMYAVEYGQTQIRNILSALGFSAQKPEQGEIENDEDDLRGWESKPSLALKKEHSEKAG